MNNQCDFKKANDASKTLGQKGSIDRSSVSRTRKSLVRVRFPSLGRSFDYYNDQFELKAGDMVYVSGCFVGTVGYVESVNFRFKVNLAKYERVVAHPVIEIHGTYRPVLDKVVSVDADALSPDRFRSWVKAPILDNDEPEDYVLGEGYSFDLDYFSESDEVDPSILNRAVEYCKSGRVRYLCVRDGVGTAFVEGSNWYEINFRFAGGHVSDLYCECPYAALCKHNLAVLITLKALLEKVDDRDFVAVDKSYFFRMLALSGQPITI